MKRARTHTQILLNADGGFFLNVNLRLKIKFIYNHG